VRRRGDIGWTRGSAAILGATILVCGGIIAHHAAGQSDRAAFDRAAWDARRRALPTYQHTPVLADFDGVVVNLHAVVAYAEAPDTGRTIIHPGGVTIPVDYATFDAVARRACRVTKWRPGG
jgi:hypothetical protein